MVNTLILMPWTEQTLNLKNEIGLLLNLTSIYN